MKTALKECNHTTSQSCLHGDECAQCLRDTPAELLETAAKIAKETAIQNGVLVRIAEIISQSVLDSTQDKEGE